MTLLNTDMISGSGAGSRKNVRTVVASGNIEITDEVIRADATAGAIVLTFVPDPSNNGQNVTVMKIDASLNPVSINNGGGVIAALVNPAVGLQYQGLQVISDGNALSVTEVS